MRNGIGADFLQHQVDGLDLRIAIAAAGIHHVQQHVGVDGFFERGAKRRHQHMWQAADKAHRVRQHHVGRSTRMHLARGGIERREQLVGCVYAAACKAVKQRGFTGVGVTHQRYRQHVRTMARAALHRALRFHLGELFLEYLDTLGEQAAVGLQLRFAGAAHADTALLPLQVGPAAHQARREMIQLRQLHLQLALETARTLGKNVENQTGAVDHPALQALF